MRASERRAQSFLWWDDLARLLTILLINGWQGTGKAFTAGMPEFLGFKPRQAPSIQHLLAEAESAGHISRRNGVQQPDSGAYYTSRLLHDRQCRGYVPLTEVDKSEILSAIDELRHPDFPKALEWLGQQPYVVLTGSLGTIAEPEGFPLAGSLEGERFLDRIVDLSCVSPAFEDESLNLVCEVFGNRCMEISAAITDPYYSPPGSDLEETKVADVLFQARHGVTYYSAIDDERCGKIECRAQEYLNAVDWLVGRLVISCNLSAENPAVKDARLWPYFLADMRDVGVLSLIDKSDYIVDQDWLLDIREAISRPHLIPRLLTKAKERREQSRKWCHRPPSKWITPSYLLRPKIKKGGKMNDSVSERIKEILSAVHELGRASEDRSATFSAVFAKLRADVPELAEMDEELLTRQLETLGRDGYFYSGERDGVNWCKVTPKALNELDMESRDDSSGANNKKGDTEMAGTVGTGTGSGRMTNEARLLLGWNNLPKDKTPEEKMAIELPLAGMVKLFGCGTSGSAGMFVGKVFKREFLKRVRPSVYSFTDKVVQLVAQFETDPGKFQLKPPARKKGGDKSKKGKGKANVRVPAPAPVRQVTVKEDADTTFMDAVAIVTKMSPSYVAATFAASHLAELNEDERVAALNAIVAIIQLPVEHQAQAHKLIAAFCGVELEE